MDPQSASALEEQLQKDLAQVNDGTDSDAESDVLPTEWEAVSPAVSVKSSNSSNSKPQKYL